MYLLIKLKKVVFQLAKYESGMSDVWLCGCIFMFLNNCHGTEMSPSQYYVCVLNLLRPLKNNISKDAIKWFCAPVTCRMSCGI